MDDDDQVHLPSTTWAWKRVKISPAPKANTTSRKATPPQPSRRNPREPLTVTIRYRGGPEAWWEVKGRGKTYRFPGYLALHDVMRTIHNIDDPR